MRPLQGFEFQVGGGLRAAGGPALGALCMRLATGRVSLRSFNPLMIAGTWRPWALSTPAKASPSSPFPAIRCAAERCNAQRWLARDPRLIASSMLPQFLHQEPGSPEAIKRFARFRHFQGRSSSHHALDDSSSEDIITLCAAQASFWKSAMSMASTLPRCLTSSGWPAAIPGPCRGTSPRQGTSDFYNRAL